MKFNYAQYMPYSNVGELDVFNAKFRGLRWRVRTAEVIVINAAFENNLPGLAHTYLEDKGLWWALAYYNGIQDPMHDVVSGMVLRIPDKDQLVALLEANVDNTAQLRL